jgi:NitT/TauT family transport system substrate-binding protein
MKKVISLLLAVVLAAALVACSAATSSSTSQEATVESEATAESTASEAASQETEATPTLSIDEPVRIAGLKGPTTMGLVNLLTLMENDNASMDYDLQLYGAADEIVPLLIKGELDMAAIPANLAATLYQKTDGGIQVMAVNTLGVLYVVEQGDTVQSLADLKGRTILSTGKGTTPEYVLRYLLTQNGIDPDTDVEIIYYSEASEVTAQMATMTDAIAVLPQPYVTAAGLQDETLRIALDLTEEWSKVCDTSLITGVTVVRTAYAEEHPDVVEAFLSDYKLSVTAANEDIDTTATRCEELGVVAKAAIAKKALPYCNIVWQVGDTMKKNVSAYLQVLYDADPTAVGGALPEDGFYFGAQ